MAYYSVHRSNELYHHGIKGQKWGVRRFQNEDGTYTAEGAARRRVDVLNNRINLYKKITTNHIYKDESEDKDLRLKKGTTVYRVTRNKNEKLKNSVYNYTDADAPVYEGAFSKYLKMTGKEYGYGDDPKIYKKTYKTTEDIVAPSFNKMVADFQTRYASDEGVRKKVDYYRNMIEWYNMAQTDSDLWKSGPTGRAFLAYNLMLENDKKEVDGIIKRFSEMGYNAVMDYNNKDIYNKAVEPFITANGKKTLKEISTEPLSNDEINENYERIKKAYGRVAL